MAKTLSPRNFILLLITIALPLSPLSAAVDPPDEVGSAARYDPPYTPNACGIDEEHLPSNGLVAAVDEELWNKAGTPPCGCTFQVRCIERPDVCRYGTAVNVTITNRIQKMVSAPSSSGVRFALSSKAYGSIADPAKDSIKIQYQQEFSGSMSTDGSPFRRLEAPFRSRCCFPASVSCSDPETQQIRERQSVGQMRD